MVQECLRERKQSKVAIMTGDEGALESLSQLRLEWLDPERDYRWSGWLVQKKVRRPAKRIVAGSYDKWFQWYMRFQRFGAFHTIILVEPVNAVSDKEHGGYIDGLLARLTAKVRQVVVISKPDDEVISNSDERRTTEVLRALLYGTRLSKPALVEKANLTFLPISEETLVRGLDKLALHLSKHQTRYQLDAYNEELLQGMVFQAPPHSEEGKPGHVEQLFRRNRRFRAKVSIPDKMLATRALEDVGKQDWVTVPYETEKLSMWLQELNRHGDSRIRMIYESNEDISNEQWEALLAPTKNQVRRVLDGLVGEGKLQRKSWRREVGRPAQAYSIPARTPFLQQNCGQCAFYASVRRRCRLWWLVNKRQPFFDDRWKQAGSPITKFEVHKMRYASRIGPHSSACPRFVDKKRDHLRKAVPEKCEICDEVLPHLQSVSVTCGNCRTRFVRFRGKMKVMTAYEHEYNRLYLEITGGDTKVDLEKWRRAIRENIRTKRGGLMPSEDFDMLAEEVTEAEPELPRVWPRFDQALQQKVDALASTTDVARQFSVAMAKSALNATRRIVAFAKLPSGDADTIVAEQEGYLALIRETRQARLLPYEALVMKRYWQCYGLALKRAQWWFGPRKRSRFVREYVEDPAGRARGYSPMDAAINYLHQRRLRQAERINEEVGFPGICDGFLHRERYNSRKIGLILDMIDPFKFADREELMLVVLDEGLTWRDFKIETDRRGSNFYYPLASAQTKLNLVGADADNMVLRYHGRDMGLVEAYREFASYLSEALISNRFGTSERDAFVFEPF
ncbi:MAG TPA: hypothetical protein VGR53_02445 [Nitrososphaerales archaeon]|nr:hypothetical protein [Nitrososphaerales archaeon]